jgi:CBS domain containing-hemolysin-like protein
MNSDPTIFLLKLVGVILLVLLNGFFVAAEFALVRVRITQLEPLISKRHRRAAIARKLIAHLDTTIGATQLGITLVSLGLGALAEPLFKELLAPVFNGVHLESQAARRVLAFGVGFSINTFLLVVVGELGPKALAIRKTLPAALWTAQPLAWFYWATYPFIWLLNHAAQWLLQQLGIQPVSEAELAHSEEELRLLFAGAQKRSGGTALGHAIVLNAFDLGRRVVREVMRPRQEIVALDTEASIPECLDVAEKTRFSRFPLCEAGDLDRTLGVVHFKDLYAIRLKARSGIDLLPVVRRIIYVPETARLEKLLQRLLDRKLHLAIVVDEYGGTVGLVTLENILEELVGQIQDEFDQETPMVTKIGEQTWEVLGTLPLHQLEELTGEPMAEEGVTTTSGWITHRLGGFPKVGDVVTLGRCELRVEEMDETRVARLRVQRLPQSEMVPSA